MAWMDLQETDGALLRRARAGEDDDVALLALERVDGVDLP